MIDFLPEFFQKSFTAQESSFSWV